MYTDPQIYGLDPLNLPSGEVLRAMTQGQLVELQHQIAVIESAAKKAGNTAVAQRATAARLEVARIYTLWGQKDLSALDRAILRLDQLNQAVAASARDIVVGTAGIVGRAAGEAVKPVAKAVLPIIPLMIAAGAVLLLSPAGKRLMGR